MKKFILKTIALSFCGAALLTGCVTEDDQRLPDFTEVIGEDFSGQDNVVLAIDGWKNFAEAGSVLWKTQVFSGNGYAEFSGYQSGEASNIGWLISPPIALEAGNTKKLRFQAAQAFVSSTANSMQVLISTDYNGTDVLGATWMPLQANLPNVDSNYFEFLDSGEISLADYSGNVYVAFRVVSGQNNTIDGSWQVDSFRVY